MVNCQQKYIYKVSSILLKVVDRVNIEIEYGSIFLSYNVSHDVATWEVNVTSIVLKLYDCVLPS